MSTQSRGASRIAGCAAVLALEAFAVAAFAAPEPCTIMPAPQRVLGVFCTFGNVVIAFFAILRGRGTE